jgi:hypothetical protein
MQEGVAPPSVDKQKHVHIVVNEVNTGPCYNPLSSDIPLLFYSLYLCLQHCELYLPLHSIIDHDKETKRISSQISKLLLSLEPLRQRLSSSSFLDRAAEHVVREARESVREKEEQLLALQSSLEDLQNMSNQTPS